MPEHNIHHLASFLENWTKNDKYFEMLRLMAQLSRLFSESKTPYLDYRLTENLFCRYFKALNDARSCTAYDARIGSVGIGIKTFILNGSDQSTEKIAEFNKLNYKIPCSGVISRPAASTSCRSFFITSAGIHLRSTLTVRTRLRLRTMSIGA